MTQMARDADSAEARGSGADPVGPDPSGLKRALRDRVDGEVRFDAGSRGAYATDGSNHRQVPIGVVVPRDLDAGAATVEVRARFGAPVLSRGGGTSLGGQCTNTAVVTGWTEYCHHLLSVDAERRTCSVEPGIVLDELNRRSRVRSEIRAEALDAQPLRAGPRIRDEECRGPAGDIGFERGHDEVSMAVGEQGVLPAVRRAPAGTLVLADGFSRRTQIEQGGTGRRAVHLAEAPAFALDGPVPGDRPERLAERPDASPRDGRLPAAAGALASAAALATAVAPRHRQRGNRTGR